MARRLTLLAILLAASSLSTRDAQAQFSGSNQTNTISAVTNTWGSDYYVRNGLSFDQLQILNGGVLIGTNGYIGPGGDADVAHLRYLRGGQMGQETL